jgi:hypothetical protein
MEKMIKFLKAHATLNAQKKRLALFAMVKGVRKSIAAMTLMKMFISAGLPKFVPPASKPVIVTCSEGMNTHGSNVQ